MIRPEVLLKQTFQAAEKGAGSLVSGIDPNAMKEKDKNKKMENGILEIENILLNTSDGADQDAVFNNIKTKLDDLKSILPDCSKPKQADWHALMALYYIYMTGVTSEKDINKAKEFQKLAEKHVTQALDADPNNFRINYFLLDTAISSGMASESESMYIAIKCYEFDPKNIKAHLNFSGIFSFEETAPQKIKLMEKFNYITNLEKFVKQNPKDADALKLVFKICCNGAKYADTDAKKKVLS